MTQAAKTSQDKRLCAEHRAVFRKERQRLRKSHDDVVRSLSNLYSDLVLHSHGKEGYWGKTIAGTFYTIHVVMVVGQGDDTNVCSEEFLHCCMSFIAVDEETWSVLISEF